MEKFRVEAASLPSRLYRVQYPRTQTAYSGDGLAAKDTNTTYSENELNAFGQSIINQMTLGHRKAQPYITCFSDKGHAQNWARKEPWGPYEGEKGRWNILIIETGLMPETWVFSLYDLVTRLGIKIPERALQHVKGAYLCLHSIPTRAIVKAASFQEVTNGMQVAAVKT